MDESTGASAEISIWRLLLALIPPLAVSVISYQLNLQIARKILISIIRTIVQLLLAGYVLLSFIFDMRSPFIVMGYLVLMIFIAALEATARQVRTYPGHFWHSTVAILASGGVMGLYGSVIVYHPSPWWEPHVVVPTAGMIIGNAISGPALAVDRLLADVAEKRHESETRLAFGASRSESVLPTMRSAILAALLPNLNQMSVVGLVSIPGMMTGQLLSGSSPLVAAEYQMSILWLIFATAAISTYIGVSLAISQGLFDKDHRLTNGRVVKRGKFSCEGFMYIAVKTALYGALKHLQGVVRSVVTGRGGVADVDGGVDYEMVRAQSMHGSPGGISNSSSNSSSNSTHGLVPSSHGLSKQHSSEASESSPLDEELHPAALSDGHSAPGDPSLSLSSGRVTFAYVQNNPQTHADADLPLGGVLFEATGVNVLSGEEPLFATSGDRADRQGGGLEGLDITLRRGERMSVEGPSGLGKTRLLRALAQLDEPLSGTMHIASRGATAAPGAGAGADPANCAMTIGVPSSYLGMGGLVPRWRCRVTYVPQAVPPLAGTPRDLIAESCAYSSRQGWDLAKEILASLGQQCGYVEHQLGLPEGSLTEAWSTLSGGQRQRAAIACALVLSGAYCACYGGSEDSDGEEEGGRGRDGLARAGSRGRERPASLLLLDEPTAACDAATALLVERAVVRSGLAVMWITHDPRQAERMAHKRLLLTSVRDPHGRAGRGSTLASRRDNSSSNVHLGAACATSSMTEKESAVAAVSVIALPAHLLESAPSRLPPLSLPTTTTTTATAAATATATAVSVSASTSVSGGKHSPVSFKTPENFPITIISGSIMSPIGHPTAAATTAPPRGLVRAPAPALAPLTPLAPLAPAPLLVPPTLADDHASTTVCAAVSMSDDTQDPASAYPSASASPASSASSASPASVVTQNPLNPPRSPRPVTAGTLSTTPAPTLSRSAWTTADASSFKLRGRSYLVDKVKAPSAPTLFPLLAVDLFTTPPHTFNIAAHPRNRVHLARQRGDPSWVIVLHIIIPGPPHLSFVAYFQGDRSKVAEDTPFGRIARPFFDGDSDAFRDSRFKLIPKVVDGNMIVKMAIKDTPTLLGTKLKQHYFRGENYFELAVAVGSSAVAKNIVGMAIGYSKSIVVDLGFCLQGEGGEELPEVIMGAVSCVRIDCARAKKL